MRLRRRSHTRSTLAGYKIFQLPLLRKSVRVRTNQQIQRNEARRTQHRRVPVYFGQVKRIKNPWPVMTKTRPGQPIGVNINNSPIHTNHQAARRSNPSGIFNIKIIFCNSKNFFGKKKKRHGVVNRAAFAIHRGIK